MYGGDIMKPINFKESNEVLHKPSNMTDKECGSLHIYSDGKQCISCWKANWVERLKFLFTGKVWLGVMNGFTQPPVWNTINKPFEKEPGRIAKLLDTLSKIW